MDRLGVWGSEVVYNPPLRHQLVDSKMPLSYEGPNAINYFWRNYRKWIASGFGGQRWCITPRSGIGWWIARCLFHMKAPMR